MFKINCIFAKYMTKILKYLYLIENQHLKVLLH